MTENEQDEYNERVTIIMGINGMTRYDAERLALERIERRRQLIEPLPFYEGPGGKER